MTEINRIEEVKKILDQHYGESPDGMGNLYIAKIICQLFPQPLDDELRKDEAKAIIRCIKDAKRVHPDWVIDDVIDLLTFREETRQALKARRTASE